MSDTTLIVNELESYLIVSINQIFYGISSYAVKEILELPALKSIPNFPSFFAGVLDYRGTTIPVIDAKISLGFELTEYNTSDVLVVIKEGTELFGLILPSLHDVQSLQKVKDTHFSQFIVEPRTNFPIITEISKYKEDLVFLFDTKALLEEVNSIFINSQKIVPEDIKGASLMGETKHHQVSNQFMLKVPENFHQIFIDRAKKLSNKFLSQEAAPTVSITIFKIGDKNFAIESEKIKEFCYIGEYAPIPSHEKLLGFMNLRGSILALADIWFLLHGERLEINMLNKVLVLEFDDTILGFVVAEADQVVSVFKSAFSDIDFENEKDDPFIKNIILMENGVIGILDVDKLFQTIIS